MTVTTSVDVWRTAWGLTLFTAMPGGAQTLSPTAMAELLRQGGDILLGRIKIDEWAGLR